MTVVSLIPCNPSIASTPVRRPATKADSPTTDGGECGAPLSQSSPRRDNHYKWSLLILAEKGKRAPGWITQIRETAADVDTTRTKLTARNLTHVRPAMNGCRGYDSALLVTLSRAGSHARKFMSQRYYHPLRQTHYFRHDRTSGRPARRRNRHADRSDLDLADRRCHAAGFVPERRLLALKWSLVLRPLAYRPSPASRSRSVILSPSRSSCSEILSQPLRPGLADVQLRTDGTDRRNAVRC
jgi:hypothetical protein